LILNSERKTQLNIDHRNVSSETEELILVDADDKETGFLSKAECHDAGGILHRAFSLFLFNSDGELLLQQRGSDKRLWPGFWSNSCCSHPRRGESMDVATQRRLRDELNIESSLQFVYKFCYTAEFGSAGAENELCHVYLGRITESVRPNDHEIDDIRFIGSQDLTKEFAAESESFTPWFKLEWQTLVRDYPDKLSGYCRP
jgi:isopentenyl-diphosphate delta-isomerase